MRSSVDFWYRRISRRATVPGPEEERRGRGEGQLSSFGGRDTRESSTPSNERRSKELTVSVRLLDSTSGRRGLSSGLGGELLSGSLEEKKRWERSAREEKDEPKGMDDDDERDELFLR